MKRQRDGGGSGGDPDDGDMGRRKRWPARYGGGRPRERNEDRSGNGERHGNFRLEDERTGDGRAGQKRRWPLRRSVERSRKRDEDEDGRGNVLSKAARADRWTGERSGNRKTDELTGGGRFGKGRRWPARHGGDALQRRGEDWDDEDRRGNVLPRTSSERDRPGDQRFGQMGGGRPARGRNGARGKSPRRGNERDYDGRRGNVLPGVWPEGRQTGDRQPHERTGGRRLGRGRRWPPRSNSGESQHRGNSRDRDDRRGNVRPGGERQRGAGYAPSGRNNGNARRGEHPGSLRGRGRDPDRSYTGPGRNRSFDGSRRTGRDQAGRRLFFAVWPDEEARQRITEFGRSLTPRRGRLVHTLDLHLTLLFLGSPDTELEAGLVERAGIVSGQSETQGFTLTLDRLSGRPHARVSWLAPSRPPRPLLDLVFRLRDAAKECGAEVERRPYVPHVTLRRWAACPRPRDIDPIEWQVRRFVMAESKSSSGARYRVLHDWPLPMPGEAGG